MKSGFQLKLKFSLILPVSVFLFFHSVLGQFSGFEDAPTRRGSASIHSGTLEGIFTETQKGENEGEKQVTITFVLTKLASAFFDLYDPVQKEIVIDLYDTRVGESALDTIKEHPITGSWIEDTQVDLNKDVAGLKPDFRDVVRIHLKSEYEIKYEIEEEFGVINLKFPWSKKIEKKYKASKTAIYWKAPLTMAVMGGLGAGIYYYYFKPEESPDICYVCIDRPGHPPSL